MKMNFWLVAASVFGCLTACGGAIDEQETNTNASDAAAMELAPMPELQHVAGSVGVDGGAGITSVAEGGLVRIRCNAQIVRVKYKYKNASFMGAGAHSVRGFVTALPSTVDAYPALAGMGSRTTWMSLSVFNLPPNTVREMTVYLDNFNTVAESNEVNNAFRARIVKVCPVP